MEANSEGEVRLQRAMLSQALQVRPLFLPKMSVGNLQSFGCFSRCELLNVTSVW